MTPRFRQVALLAASLGLLLSLFLALRPEDDEPAGTTGSTVAATTTVGTTTAPPPATTGDQGPGAVHIDLAVSGGRPVGGIGRDSVARGRVVILRVTSDVADEVHLHGYDLSAEVGPGAPARLEFEATVPGRFEVELEESGVQVGELEIRP